MRTLRVKLIIPESDSYETARATFDALADLHADQSIFQVNQTPYVDAETWGFQIRYETELQTTQDFVRSTSLREVERVMAEVASDSFEQRAEESC